MGNLSGKVALVTGASRGLGYAIACELWAEGASLVLVSLTPEIHFVADSIRHNPINQNILTMNMDVSNPEDWPSMVDYITKTYGTVHIAVCNAGVYGPIGRTEDVPWREWEQALHTNVLGTVLTCRAVVPLMRRQQYGKIIVISGGGATRPLPRFSAYAASKAAVVRFAETLAVELKGSGIDVNSVAPGALNTRMLKQVLEAGPEKAGRVFYAKAVEQQQEGGTPLKTPARLVAFLASTECDGITGRLISAVWDNWPALPTESLQANPDRYTLRRVP